MWWFILFLHGAGLCSPPQYSASPYATQKAEKVGGDWHYKFQFRGPGGQRHSWQWSQGQYESQNLVSAYGLPTHLRRPGGLDGIGRERLRQMVRESKFRTKEGKLTPDMSALVNTYRGSLRPLFQIWQDEAQKRNLNGRAQIDLLLNFLQDIPYGLPPDELGSRYIHGLFPPPSVFQNKYGDCDSKALIMAAVLSHHSEYRHKLIFITVPGHMLLGIEAIPRPFDQFIEYKGMKYVMAEPVGLNRTPFGKGNEDYRRIVDYEPVDSLPSDSPAPTKESGNSPECPEISFMVDFTSPFSKERSLTCTTKREGQFVNHGPRWVLNSDGSVKSKSLYKMGVEF